MPAKTTQEALKLAEAGKDATLELQLNGKVVDSGSFVAKLEEEAEALLNERSNFPDAQTRPELRLPKTSASTSRCFIGICIDLDPPFRSFPLLGPILHWLQSDLEVGQDGTIVAGNSQASAIAEYIGPKPPPISGPHRYLFYLHEQPAGFDATQFRAPDGQDLAVSKRMWWNPDTFAKKAGLGPVVAASYFETH
ncbi:Carboxypeptidase Y inhibitor [Lachnellula arida]|uniref:Carboxypeptidase Y inhibitor n=1 Tax=Lachnellula arida TaxID=1316785 RepID=A0A8T9B5S4_9HELO|nr:Carboxypeptidase Y inhibitor [Lachnellula arida]